MNVSFKRWKMKRSSLQKGLWGGEIWGGDDKCIRCGEMASLIVEIDGDVLPQPMCSKCVPQDVKDGIRDVLLKLRL